MIRLSLRRWCFVGCAAAGLVGVAGAAYLAQPEMDMAEMMRMWEEANAPGAHHEHLKAFAGRWDAKMTYRHARDGEESHSTGSLNSELIMGGRFLRGTFKGNIPEMGREFDGISIWGYNNATREYETVWIDSMSTALWTEKGTCDEAGKEFTFESEFIDPLRGKIRSRTVMGVEGPDSHWMEMFEYDDQGPWLKMRIDYTRKQ